MEVYETRLYRDDWDDALAEADGRRIIVAGPGTGKTRFLVRQVAAILDSGQAAPSEVVGLSFSRRSSRRLRDQIDEVRGSTGQPVDVGSFHSLALRLIETATGGERPMPLTTPEQVSLVRQTLREEDPGDWPLLYRGILDSPMFSAEVADFLLRCSERLLSSEHLTEMTELRTDWRGLPGLFETYTRRLDEIGRTDYGLLLARAVELLRTDEGSHLTAGFQYVLVDEYQDTSPAQAAMAELLASHTGNLTVAGDPYQSIFSFRGAELANIAEFSAVPGTRRIILAESFRVPSQILESALGVVSAGELPGAAGTVEPAAHDGVAETFLFDQETAEAEWISREIERLIRVDGLAPKDIAVLVRSKREFVSELSRALDRRHIPHDPPDSRLVDHPSVRLVQDLVAIAVDDEPDASPTAQANVDSAVRRVLLGPLFTLSISLEREMARERRRHGTTWKQIIASSLDGVEGLLGLLDDPAWANTGRAADGFWTLWTNLDSIPAIVHDSQRADWRRAWAAFAQTLSRQAERDPSVTLQRFFEMVESDDFEATPLISMNPLSNQVTVTTLHQSKGLEFDVVFIANAVEGVFPDLRRSRRLLRPELLSPERTVDPEAQQLFQIQEEMRLAYTAMTRARLRVVWTATEAGVDQGGRRPSRFLLSVAGGTALGPPREGTHPPLTMREAEAVLRRSAIDASTAPAERLAAMSIIAQADNGWWDAAHFPGVVARRPDTGVMPRPFRMSPSQASAYEECPRRYVLERRVRLGDSTSAYAHFGELVHEVLQVAEREAIGTGVRHAALERVLEITDRVWEEKADFGMPALTASWKLKAIATLRKLYDNWPGKGVPVAVEERADAEIGGVRWTGRIDRIEETAEGLRIVDYKTGTRAPTKDEASESIQLGFYAYATARARGEAPVASEMWFPRTSTQSVTTRSLSMHLLPDMEEKMSEITAAIDSEDWEPRVGVRCGSCPFKTSCPAWPEGRGAFLQ